MVDHVIVHKIFHSGMVNIVLSVQLEPHMIQKKDNVIIAQMDLSEMQIHTHVFQGFDWMTFYVKIFKIKLFYSVFY